MKKISNAIRMFRNIRNSVEYNIEPYQRVLQEINAFQFHSLSDNALRGISGELKDRAVSGASADSLLAESFALVREAASRVLGMRPFDTQMIAGVALHQGKIAEMQTGEGKTLAAVMPAYLNALTGGGVHILTFNDYLARRDAQWMGPVFQFLGLAAGYVNEGMSATERRQAYSADITYVTAKEAGFDYLRDFLCMEKENLVHRPFHYAIVDEADSILIDEARSPLVIAGAGEDDLEDPLRLSGILRSLKQGVDYDTDQYKSNAFFTDLGLGRLENILGCGNLYAPKNLRLLTRLNCALYAEALIKRDKDYIVKDNKIKLVDEFTGRVAANRRWPESLHAAVEAKEGLISKANGVIMGSIALQYFLGLYPRIAGMTGTAAMAANEFREFYGLEVLVVPPNRPCIREDRPDAIFLSKKSKQEALIAEIKRIHGTGQPILIGAGSVEESDLLAAELKNIGIFCRVLNAKNDEEEAKTIARAGEPGTITVSTNMAGRGVDIKLGGQSEQDQSRVAALGGLCVIGTNRHEGRRIDNQLRGRAGRQGDPGESKFIISLEDDLIKRYDIAKLIPSGKLPLKQHGPVKNPAVLQAVEKGQRIVEGYYSDIRRQLWKYSYLIEQQRRLIHRKRQDILLDKAPPELLAAKVPDRYRQMQAQVGKEALITLEKQISLYQINKCWAEYLEYISYEREGVHLVAIGRKDPLTEFHRIAIAAFDQMLANIDSEIVRTFENLAIGKEGIDMAEAGLKGPSATWTYLINDSPDQYSRLPSLIKAAIAKINF